MQMTEAEARAQIFQIVEDGDLELLRAILIHYPGVLQQADEDGDTPAICAARKGDREVLALMIEKDSSVLQQADKYGNTPAIRAAISGHREALALMIEKDPSVLKQANGNGDTLAILAAFNGHREVMALMIEKDPSVLKQAHRDAKTPAMYAAIADRREVLALMIEKDSSVLQQADNNGNTPAMYAAMFRRFEVLALMIDKDPSVLTQVDRDGTTLARRAARKGDGSALALIYIYTANENNKVDVARKFSRFLEGKVQTVEFIKLPTMSEIRASIGQIRRDIIDLERRPFSGDQNTDEKNLKTDQASETEGLLNNLHDQLGKLDTNIGEFFPKLYQWYAILSCRLACICNDRDAAWEAAGRIVETTSQDEDDEVIKIASYFLEESAKADDPTKRDAYQEIAKHLFSCCHKKELYDRFQHDKAQRELSLAPKEVDEFKAIVDQFQNIGRVSGGALFIRAHPQLSPFQSDIQQHINLEESSVTLKQALMVKDILERALEEMKKVQEEKPPEVILIEQLLKQLKTVCKSTYDEDQYRDTGPSRG